MFFKRSGKNKKNLFMSQPILFLTASLLHMMKIPNLTPSGFMPNQNMKVKKLLVVTE